jgi:hypothetical protein
VVTLHIFNAILKHIVNNCKILWILLKTTIPEHVDPAYFSELPWLSTLAIYERASSTHKTIKQCISLKDSEIRQ